jgi:hypothetical protein
VEPPPDILAAAEQDYDAMRDSVAQAVQGARLLHATWSEVEVFAKVYNALSRLNPGEDRRATPRRSSAGRRQRPTCISTASRQRCTCARRRGLNGLLPGLGAVALVVGGVGIANTMVISVLERRAEIGLRRSLGATRAQVRSQFLVESPLLSAAGDAVGCCQRRSGG